MFSSIHERRMQSNGMDEYAVILQIPEDEFFLVYDSPAPEYAREIAVNYLKYHGDDGRPDHISIYHDKPLHLISISLYLHYTDNQHTQSPSENIPELRSHTSSGIPTD